MTNLYINTNLLRTNVEASLNEVKMNLKSIQTSAQRVSTSVTFPGSDKIANIPSKIEKCTNGINTTVEWYNTCASNYERFSSESITDIDGLEVSPIKVKDFNI